MVIMVPFATIFAPTPHPYLHIHVQQLFCPAQIIDLTSERNRITDLPIVRNEEPAHRQLTATYCGLFKVGSCTKI